MKYKNWRELAVECQESGRSVYTWCKEKNIPVTTCRQWLDKLKKENNLQRLEETTNQEFDLPVWGKIDLGESNQREPQILSSKGIDNICLRYHAWSIELSPSFNPSLLKHIMKVVESVC